MKTSKSRIKRKMMISDFKTEVMENETRKSELFNRDDK